MNIFLPTGRKIFKDLKYVPPKVFNFTVGSIWLLILQGTTSQALHYTLYSKCFYFNNLLIRDNFVQ